MKEEITDDIEKLLLEYSYWLNANHITHLTDYIDIQEVKDFIEYNPNF